jgi:peptidyl-tRNA hydrolase, PTH1 family
VSAGELDGVAVRVLKPTTMMNRSGAALASLRAEPAFSPATDLLVVVDDFNIPLGTHRFRPSGSAGGHNGLRSIEGALQSQEYPRVRVGIGPLPSDIPWEDFVLSPFEPGEEEQLRRQLPGLVDVVSQWIGEGIP